MPDRDICLAETIPDMFQRRVAATPDAIAYREFFDGQWQDISWCHVAEKVATRRMALTRAGLQRGERVGIFLPNGVDWVVTDLAAMSEGLVTVPVYTRDSASNICHVIRDSGAALCITDTAARWLSLGHDSENLPDLRQVWLLDEEPDGNDARVVACPVPNMAQQDPAPAVACYGEDLATLIYTSGTTGPSKGVMLSHGALLSNARSVAQVNPVRGNDVFLSLLPLAHSFERTMGWLCPMLGGATVAYARSVETLTEDMQTVRPTVMLAVPRLFEKVRNTAVSRSESSRFNRWLLRATESAGWARRQAAEGAAPSPTLSKRLFWVLIGRLVAQRLRRVFGGRIRIVVSSGAPLSADTARFLDAMEFPLVEGYGLTEAGPAVTGSSLQNRRSGSVGQALPGVELAIGERQELLVRSPGVMKGYWHNTQTSQETLDDEGWLYTGDAAEIIDGWVFIRGRIKDVIVLSTGENVNPGPIEMAILSDPLIDQTCVLGDGRPWCAAVVVIDPRAFQDWIAQTKGGDTDPTSPETQKILAERLAARMNDVPPFARIRSVVVETQPWDLGSGLITPTLKAKRPRIAERYAEKLDALYG